MSVLLLGGNENAGKTEALNRLAKYLQNQKKFQTGLPKKDTGVLGSDYIYHLQNANKTKNVIINTAADDKACIDCFKGFIDTYKQTYKTLADVILVSAIRCKDGDPIRDDLLNYINVEFSIVEDEMDRKNVLIEMPVTHFRKTNFTNPIYAWHREKVDLILQKLLSHPPFNI